MIEANGYTGVIIAFTPAFSFLTDEELGKVVRALLANEGRIENPFDSKTEKVLAIAYEEFLEAADTFKFELDL